MDSQNKISLLRKQLVEKSIDYFLVPREDEFLGEYIASDQERLKWLTHFSGSAGMAIVGHDQAYIFVDGRYVLQAQNQVDQNIYEVIHTGDVSILNWIKKNISKDKVIGYDPKLHSTHFINQLEKTISEGGTKAQPLDENLIDILWQDKPVQDQKKMTLHPINLAGQPTEEKLSFICEGLKENNVEACAIGALDSIAWLLNIRGQDIETIPVTRSYIFIHSNQKITFYVDKEKCPEPIDAFLPSSLVNVKSFEEFEVDLQKKYSKVQIDPQNCNAWIKISLEKHGNKILCQQDPCLLLKACKNKTELQGVRNAHLKDGIALTKFLHWIDKTIQNTDISELDVVEKLDLFRQEQENYMGKSFDTISGSGPNGAIIHYKVDESSNRILKKNELFLLDSGGQYLEGTTDITRTLVFDQPTDEMRKFYTLVLKGHIALGSARFPKNTSGSQLDTLARQFLWQYGTDFDHGTGHGVGAYLSVHEGPQRISKAPSNVYLQPGMIISNEPGYYRNGEFGIRLENLIAVIPSQANHFERKTFEFETLSFAPFDPKLIDISLLNQDEIDWLNAYHQDVFDKISPSLNTEEKEWLFNQTKKLNKEQSH